MRIRLLILAGLLTVFLGCTSEKDSPNELQRAAHELKRSRHNYNNRQKAHYYEQQARLNPEYRYDHRLAQAQEYLRAGENEKAIELFAQLQQIVDSATIFYSRMDKPEFREELRRYWALASLRLGEQENCILNHHHHSCIVPISAQAVHQLPRGSEEAIRYYQQLLQRSPDDYESRYLLNLAYMTLGQYPAAVPDSLLMRSPLFEKSASNLVKDVAMTKGLDVIGLAGGVVAEDFNGDGHIDLLISSWDMQTPVQLFLNDGESNWTESTVEANLTAIPGGLNMLQTDYNNDHQPDVLILRGGWLGLYGTLPNTLLKNEGPDENGVPRFTDVTRPAGLHSEFPTQTAVWADFNNDGWLDVFIGNESAVTGYANPSELYLNQQDGTFREVATEAGVAMHNVLKSQTLTIKGVAAADYDRDGRIDLFLSTRDGPNFLFRNRSINNDQVPVFEDVTEHSGIAPYAKTFTGWFWDYNNDGWEDLLVSGFHAESLGEGKSIAEAFAREQLGEKHTATTGMLYENQGDGTFVDVSEATGLDKILYMMGGNFGDIENDGWLDFYCGNGEPDMRSVIPNRMFCFRGEQFEEVTNRGFGHLQKGHGTAFADFDQDGDQDIYTVVGGFYEGDVYQNILLENLQQTNNHFVDIQLRGTNSNAPGVGSQLEIVVSAADTTRRIFRTVNSGGSFGASPFTQHIGLGDAVTVDTLSITWAGSGIKQVLTDLPADRRYTIEEAYPER